MTPTPDLWLLLAAGGFAFALGRLGRLGRLRFGRDRVGRQSEAR